MDHKLQYTQNLSQEQVIAPQQIQALNILVAPMLELQKKILQEAEVNPTLEIISTNESPSGDLLNEELPGSDNKDDLAADVISRDEALLDLISTNDNWNDYVPGAAASNSESETQRQHFFDSQTAEQSLSENLLEQLRQLNCDELTYEIAVDIIGSLNDHGFLTATLEEIASLNECTQKKVKETLEIIQNFEPVGIASFDFRGCVLKQMERRGAIKNLAYKIIDKHLAMIEKNHIPQLAKKLKVTPADIYRALKDIRQFKPYPVKVSGTARFIQADIIVEKDEYGELICRNNNDSIPRIRISEQYEKLLKDSQTTMETKAYLREKILSSKNLIYSIAERGQTLLRISLILIRLQKKFFTHGIEALKPLTMGRIADELGVNESTVSRAVSEKYMQTEKGLIPFRFFFNSGYVADDGKAYTSLYIKQQIADLIQLEDSKNPLSDQQIVEEFSRMGLQISARTVSKYREDQGLAPAKLRRIFS